MLLHGPQQGIKGCVFTCAGVLGFGAGKLLRASMFRLLIESDLRGCAVQAQPCIDLYRSC